MFSTLSWNYARLNKFFLFCCLYWTREAKQSFIYFLSISMENLFRCDQDSYNKSKYKLILAVKDYSLIMFQVELNVPKHNVHTTSLTLGLAIIGFLFSSTSLRYIENGKEHFSKRLKSPPNNWKGYQGLLCWTFIKGYIFSVFCQESFHTDFEVKIR